MNEGEEDDKDVLEAAELGLSSSRAKAERETDGRAGASGEGSFLAEVMDNDGPQSKAKAGKLTGKAAQSGDSHTQASQLVSRLR